jgi:hypothetical protein
MVGLLSLLLAARPAYAWEQLFLSSELTITLGARHPFGFAVSAQLGEAPIADTGPDLRAVAEFAYGPSGFALSVLGRVGVMVSGQFGYTSWWYLAGPETYTEVGATFRPSSIGSKRGTVRRAGPSRAGSIRPGSASPATPSEPSRLRG